MLLLFLFVGFAINQLFDHKSPSGQGSGWDGPPIAGIIFAFVAIAFLFRFLRRTAAPIADVMEAAERVANGDYTTRVNPRGPREVRRMAAAFNEMTGRLEANDEQRRRLLADVTHELRTPLSVIQGNVEGMLDGLYPRDDEHLSPIVAETKHMARLLDDLHTLATAEAGALRLHKEPTHPGDLLRDVVRAFTPRAGERGIQIELADAEMPNMTFDPVRLRQVVENLLSNAIRYTPDRGVIQVKGSVDRGLLSISVADSGPGVPPESLPHLFERFSKSADSGGSGLGLSIARRLVEAHGGDITAQNRTEGGLEVRITIPNAE